MTPAGGLLAVITARGGSRGLPGKNTRPFAGLPLIAHTILMARRVPEIARCIVSTDSEEIAGVARTYGADVPFLRPPELAESDTPIWPVLRHALARIEEDEGRSYAYLLLADPTSPTRRPEWISEAFRRLEARPEADGIIAVSKPDLNPVWVSVVERGGWMTELFEGGSAYTRRQDLPPVYRINGMFYLWRTEFVRRNATDSWRSDAKLMMYETPEGRAFAIDTLEQFERAEILVKSGHLELPWLEDA